MTTYSDVAFFGAPLPNASALNSTLNSTLNANLNESTNALDIPLFVATWNPFVLIYHLLNHPKIKDYVGLIALGLVAEFTRRLSKYLFPYLETLICVKATSAALDPSHDYLLSYWIARPEWIDHAKRFEAETSNISGAARVMPWLQHFGKKNFKGKGSILEKRAPPQVRAMPKLGESISFWWRKRLVRLSRENKDDNRQEDYSQWITCRIFGGDLQMYKDFLAECKQGFQEDDNDLLPIKMIDSKDGGKWTQVALRSKRPIASVITSNNIAEDVAKDMREFLDSESWYTNRGIPWRRGYLLYGAAGAGKTSLIHACASALDLEVYCITLATEGLTDAILLKAMTLIPPGGVVVMEDVDVAIPKTSNEGLNRDDAPSKKEEENHKKGDRGSSGGHITLSGLLNAIDGISGSDGRLLFMTTNKKEMLDEALIRPGRADLSFEFFKATTDQIERMFKAFFPVDEIIKANSSHADTDSGDEEDEKSIWTDEYIGQLARLYSAKVPKEFLSTAAVQGHLMVHKNSPRTAVGTIGEYIEKKQAEIAKAEEEKAKKEAEEKGSETKVDKEEADEKNKGDGEDKQVKAEAIKLAAAAIIGLVTKALEKPEETEKSEEEAKIDVEKAEIKRVEQERKADGLAVEVEGC